MKFNFLYIIPFLFLLFFSHSSFSSDSFNASCLGELSDVCSNGNGNCGMYMNNEYNLKFFPPGTMSPDIGKICSGHAVCPDGYWATFGTCLCVNEDPITGKCKTPPSSSGSTSSTCPNGDCAHSSDSNSSMACVNGFNSFTQSCNPISCGPNQITVNIDGNIQCADVIPASSAANTSQPNSGGSGGSTGDQSNTSAGSGVGAVSSVSNSSLPNAGGGPSQQSQDNCVLAFGANNTCVPISKSQTCPNMYTDNSGQRWCLVAKGGGSNNSAANGSASNALSSKQSGKCDPTAPDYDDCMGRNKTPSISDTQGVNDNFKNQTDKQLKDLYDDVNGQINETSTNGVSFKDSPNALKSAFLAVIPKPSSCHQITLTSRYFSGSLDCAKFEYFKSVFAWWLYIMTVYYIFMLALKPIEDK